MFGAWGSAWPEGGLKAELQTSLVAYAGERNRVLDGILESIANGENPATVASVVLEAVTSRSPRLRYPAGREAKFLSRLARLVSAMFLDRGLRKQFGLGAA